MLYNTYSPETQRIKTEVRRTVPHWLKKCIYHCRIQVFIQSPIKLCKRFTSASVNTKHFVTKAISHPKKTESPVSLDLVKSLN